MADDLPPPPDEAPSSRIQRPVPARPDVRDGLVDPAEQPPPVLEPGLPTLSRARRTAVIAAAGYVISPVDLVPGVIPVLGQLDDIAVALLALRLALDGLHPERRRAHLEAAALDEMPIWPRTSARSAPRRPASARSGIRVSVRVLREGAHLGEEAAGLATRSAMAGATRLRASVGEGWRRRPRGISRHLPGRRRNDEPPDSAAQPLPLDPAGAVHHRCHVCSRRRPWRTRRAGPRSMSWRRASSRWRAFRPATPTHATRRRPVRSHSAPVGEHREHLHPVRRPRGHGRARGEGTAERLRVAPGRPSKERCHERVVIGTPEQVDPPSSPQDTARLVHAHSHTFAGTDVTPSDGRARRGGAGRVLVEPNRPEAATERRRRRTSAAVRAGNGRGRAAVPRTRRRRGAAAAAQPLPPARLVGAVARRGQGRSSPSTATCGHLLPARFERQDRPVELVKPIAALDAGELAMAPNSASTATARYRIVHIRVLRWLRLRNRIRML